MMATIPPKLVGLPKKDEPFLGYRLVELIGRGSYGEVWHGISPAGKAVALKIFKSENEQAARRELRALQSIRQLRHPNLVSTYQVWADSEKVVVVMELAEGTLLDLLHLALEMTGKPLEPKIACHYLRQAARALDFLNARQHELNGQRVAVRHCDVKPSNMLLFSNVLKMADFSFSVQSTSTIGSFDRAGTLHFAAPEVFQGWLSETSDQFALAVTYCQMRTGEYPFPDPPPNFARDYVRPAPNLSGLTPEEAAIVSRALHPIPQNRWPTCTEFMDRLYQSVRALKTSAEE